MPDYQYMYVSVCMYVCVCECDVMLAVSLFSQRNKSTDLLGKECENCECRVGADIHSKIFSVS